MNDFGLLAGLIVVILFAAAGEGPRILKHYRAWRATYLDGRYLRACERERREVARALTMRVMP